MIASEISLGLGLTCTDQLKLTPWGQRIALPTSGEGKAIR